MKKSIFAFLVMGALVVGSSNANETILACKDCSVKIACKDCNVKIACKDCGVNVKAV